MSIVSRGFKLVRLVSVCAVMILSIGCSASKNEDPATIELRLESAIEEAFDGFLGDGNYSYTYTIQGRSFKEHEISAADREKIKNMEHAALRVSTETLNLDLSIEIRASTALRNCEKLIDNKPSCAFCKQLRTAARSGEFSAGTQVAYTNVRYVEDYMDREITIDGQTVSQYWGRFFGYC